MDEDREANAETAIQALMQIAQTATEHAASSPVVAEIAGMANKAVREILARRMGVAADLPEGRVAIRLDGPSAPDRRRWARWVMDCDQHARTGHGIDGPFLKVGQVVALPPWALVIEHEDRGDPLHAWTRISLVENGELRNLGEYTGKGWFLAFRDYVRDTLPKTYRLRAAQKPG